MTSAVPDRESALRDEAVMLSYLTMICQLLDVEYCLLPSGHMCYFHCWEIQKTCRFSR